MVSKVVILAAGSASRMQKNIERYISNSEELSAVKKGEKMATKFGSFPFLDYQILNVIHAGLEEINLVLKPEDTFFTTHYNRHGKLLFPEVNITFSFQEIPDGTAHAVLAAEEFVCGDSFVVLNGDNNYSAETIRMIMNTPENICSMVAFDKDGFSERLKEKLKTLAVIETSNGKLIKIIEKSQNPEKHQTSDLLYTSGDRRINVTDRILTSMNLWCFASDMIDICRNVKRHEPRKPGKAGEFELPDAVDQWIHNGGDVLVYYGCEDILDLTNAEDIEIVGRSIFTDLKDKVHDLEQRYKHL
jgi:glucose-1-phosphate thymidylyltransferase